MRIDLIVYNGTIHTMEKESPKYQWMSIHNGRIVEIGKGEPDPRKLENVSESLDLKGRHVYPGFIDSHVHLVQTALNRLSLNLSHCCSIGEIKATIKTYIEMQICKEDTIIHGYGVDETQLLEKRLPDRKDLDACSREYPIWINRIDYHTTVVNSRALHMCSIPFTLKGIERENKGLPTGRFKSEASAWIRNFMLNKISDELRREGVEIALKDFVQKGVTSLNCMEGGYLFHDKDADFIYDHGNEFPIDLYLYYQTLDVRKAISLGLQRIGGCIFVDGSMGTYTAAIEAPYCDKPSSNGMLYFDQQSMNEFVGSAHRNGIQVAVHAIGDRAIEQALTAYEAAALKYPEIHIQHRIEHFELPTDAHIIRAKKLGVIISCQPAYEYYWGDEDGMYTTRLGYDRKCKTNPFRKMFDAGLIVAGGSDCDVTPCHPLFGMHMAVNHPNKQHALTIYEALQMFTSFAAMAVNDFENKGSLDVGKLADFVVLDQDLFEIDQKAIKDMEVQATFKEGIELFHKEGVRS